MHHSKAGEAADLLAAIENAPEILDVSGNTVTQCSKPCDDGEPERNLVSLCVDSDTLGVATQCEDDLTLVAQCDTGFVAQCDNGQ